MDTLSRRELLDLWRQKTGRTPMKRLSYLQPCANSITPAVRKATKCHLTQSLSVHQRRRTDTQGRTENTAATVTKGLQRRHLQSREGVLTPLSNKNGGRQIDSAERSRTAMKEVFQKDIDNTIAEILACNSPHASSSEGISKELQFEFEGSERQACDVGDHSTRKKLRKRRSSAYYVDSELAFESSRICYTAVASERRRRKSRGSVHRVTPDAKCLYLTPVKRSTRRGKSRSLCLTNPAVEVLFDSPSEAGGQEGCEGVRVLPNEALAIITPLHNATISLQ